VCKNKSAITFGVVKDNKDFFLNIPSKIDQIKINKAKFLRTAP
jgi:hypothetical protein